MHKTIFITGASTGLGRATALLFAEQGWNIIATMRTPENGADLAAHSNITVLPPALHSIDDAEMPVGSCGFPRTGMDVAILDDAGQHLPPHATGEICVRGPGVFAGYHDNAEATAKATTFGWFHTGDLGHVDARGFVYITGRASDMYISGGSNVYPREIEEVLLLHPAVAEVCIVGLPDERWGESGVAVLVLEDGASVSDPSSQLPEKELVSIIFL